jgi:hypothetical protein
MLAVARLLAINANDVIVTPMVGSGGICIWWESLESGGRVCVSAFGSNLASVALKVLLAFNLLCEDML